MFEEDLSVFFNSAEMSDQFTILSTGHSFSGVFDREYIETDEISGYSPVITCATADAEGLSRGDILEHFEARKQYKFILQEPDGTGTTRLILERHK